MVSREAIVLLFYVFIVFNLINEKGEAAASPIPLLFRPEHIPKKKDDGDDDCFKCYLHILVVFKYLGLYRDQSWHER